jgi:hypothetical protein
MLIVLAIGSGALAVMRMAAWWVLVPPALMLSGYLVLLREAATADAERRELVRAREARSAAARRAAPAAARTAAGRTPASAPAAISGAGASAPGAEIIDLSASRREDFYDQYADAKLRAVGD